MINTIIFDFGDIFIDLDKGAFKSEIRNRIGTKHLNTLRDVNKSYEKGSISSDDFFQEYAHFIPDLSQKDFEALWNSILIEFPRYRFHFIQQLSENKPYQLILLSNTNSLHISWVKENFKAYNEFKSFFHGFYLSHDIGMCKPDPKIFQFVIDRHNLSPQQTLFIDDTKKNTDAAAALGLNIWNLNPDKEDIVELFLQNEDLF